LFRFFAEKFPDLPISEISLGYEVEKLSSPNSERKKARKSKKFCQKADRENGSQLMVSTRSFSGIWCYICCRCENFVPAAEFYKQEELRLTVECMSEKAEVLTGKTNVTFNTETTAKKFIEEYRSRPAEHKEWSVRFSPPRQDQIWEKIDRSRKKLNTKAIVFNATLAILLCCFTTPSLVASDIIIAIELMSAIKTESETETKEI
jgi:hypothetical protein